MSDDTNDKPSWKTTPLPAFKHSLFCTVGSSCQTPGCKEMKSCAGHTNNCYNPRCPAPPCIARRQLNEESDCQRHINTIMQCGIWATDILPIVALPRPSVSSDNSSLSTSSSSSNNSSNKTKRTVFRVPTHPPPKKRRKLDPGDRNPKA